MLASYLLAFREGLEAALTVAIVLSVLRRTSRTKLVPTVWRGVITAVIVSFIAALALNIAGAEFEGPTEIIFEGSTMLLAAGLLTWMVFWMQKQVRRRNQELESEILAAADQGGHKGLFFLAFLAVLREGVELAVFLLAARFETTTVETIAGALMGLGTAALMGLLVFRTTRRLNLKRIFRTTNIFLALFAAGLVANGIHEFIELGLIPPLMDPVWTITSFLSEKSTIGSFFRAMFGYNSSPTLVEAAAYCAYFVILLVGIYLSNRRNSPQPAG